MKKENKFFFNISSALVRNLGIKVQKYTVKIYSYRITGKTSGSGNDG
jgi:hypothetical protein